MSEIKVSKVSMLKFRLMSTFKRIKEAYSKPRMKSV